uniref:Ig-like domain-containing protein n=1 Tax=Equus caballus TaxID=9796 RepID=F6PJ59_HORSE
MLSWGSPSLPFLGLLSSPTGHTEPGLSQNPITQEPRHYVTKMRQAVTLTCEPVSNHTALFWYRQTSVKGLKFLIYLRNQAPIAQTGMPKDRFSAEMPNRSLSTLKIQRTEPGDSAMYICASSLATALQSPPLCS